MISLELAKGTSRDFSFQVRKADETPATGVFLGTDTLAAKLWPGGDLPSILSPTAAWIDANAGTWQLVFNDADTAAVSPGIYYVQATATRSTRSVNLLPEGTTLEVLAVPGTGLARPTYITITDLRRVAPWIDELQPPDSQTGFLDQCADSRDWLDECVLRNYRGGNVSLLGEHGAALDGWFTGGGRRTSLTNRWIKAELDASHLLVTPRVRQICAYYALSRICEAMLTRGNQYYGHAARFRAEAESLLASTVVEIDVNGDGFGEIPVNMSSTNTLWA